MVQFVRFPEGVSPQMGYRLLGNPSNGINIKRATVEQVGPDQVTKTPKVYDLRVGRVLPAAIASGEFKVTRLPRRGPRPGQASMTRKEDLAARHLERRIKQGWVSL